MKLFKKGEKQMNKFKTGDRVRVIAGWCKGYEGVVVETDTGSFGDTILCRFKNFNGHHGNGVTKRGKDYDTSDHWYVYPDWIELIKDETIVIYRKDDKVIALDKRTGKKTEAKCHPDDEFNFETGAKLAFERLLEEPEKEERYYNGKIIFTKGDHFFKTGHIYEIIDGKFSEKIANRELPYGLTFKSLHDIEDYFTKGLGQEPKWSVDRTLKFIEVLDDQ